MGKSVTTFPKLHSRYEIREQIGEGGMSTVYKAWDRIAERQVVLKHALPGVSGKTLFLREYEILFSLNHPHLPKAFDLYTAEDSMFFTMDVAEGKHLKAFIHSEGLTSSDFFYIFFQLLSALQYCHNHNIVHYDLKPENIIIRDPEGLSALSITLIDFGLAQKEDRPRSDTLQGTIQYTAPEVIKKEKGDHRSDLYALGVILYEMAAGKNPFDDANVVNVVVNHLEKKIQTVETVHPFVTEEVQKIMLKLLEKDPQYRYQNVEEIYRDLKPIRAQFEPVELEERFVLHSCFVNRGNELAKLTETVKQFFIETRTEKFSELWITGEDGVGKSSLLNHFKLSLEKDGFNVISMRVMPSRSLDHVRLFLRELLYASSYTKSEEEFPHEWQWIQNRAASTDSTDRESLFSGLSELVISSLTGISRLCVLMDDADQLNDFEKSFFEYLFRKLAYAAPKAAFIMTAQHHDAPFLELDNFDLPETDQYVKTLLNENPLNEEISKTLFETTRGNPFLINNTLAYLIQTDALVKSDGEWRLLKEKIAALPSTILDFVHAKIKGLTSEDKGTLEYASIFPSTFTIEELRILDQSSHLRMNLQRLVAGSLIDQTGSTFIFSSSYLRNHIYQNIPEALAETHHLALAHYYESADQKKNIAALAYHYFHSPERISALPFLLELAEIQKVSFFPKESLESLHQAVLILRQSDTKSQLPDTLFKMEAIYDQLGQRKDQETVIAELLDIARKQVKKENTVKALLRKANYLERVSRFEESQKICEDAIRVSMDNAGGYFLGQLYRQLGRGYYNRALWQDALTQYQKAYECAIHTGDKKLEMECLNSLGTVYGSMADYVKAREYFLKTNELSEALNDLERKTNAIFNLARIAYKMNDLDEALSLSHHAADLLKTLKNRKLDQLIFQQTASIYLDMHLYEGAFEFNQRVLSLSFELNDELSAEVAAGKQGLVCFRLGLYNQSRTFIEQSINRATFLNNKKSLHQRRLLLVELDLAEGKWDNVVRIAEESLHYFTKNNYDELTFYAKLTLLKIGAESNFKIISLKNIENILEPTGDLISGKIHTTHPSLRILAHYLISKSMRNSGDLLKAITHSNEAISMLDHHKYYEFNSAEVYYNHYLTIMGSNTPRSVIGSYLEKAYRSIKGIEDNLKRSDFKASFMNLPIHREIINEYKLFFSEEREFDIQSFQKLYEITQDINSILEPGKLFDRIMDNAIDNTQSDRGLILIKSDISDHFEIKVARNIDQETLSDMTHISQSIVEEVYQTGQSIVTADANLDDRFKSRKSIVAYNIRSIMCVPLNIKNDIIGAVYVDKQFDTHYFSPRNLKFLESFANIAGIAIENARLYEKLNLEKDYLSKENIELKTELQEKFLKYNIIGSSKPMKQVFHLIENAADNTANVLIQGESGTGKELVAKAIHYNGNRKNKKFVAVDCGALPENLLESELFGYKKGAFTGANSDKKGLFEEADGGTIFLDEITNTSLNFQSRLLRVIQEGEIRRVGDNETRKIDVRSIVATNRNLLEQVKAGLFREDLYYRLNVIPISLPPLRERQEDIPLLVQFFIDKHNKANNKNIRSVSSELMEKLIRHPWPGNIRELENILSRMIILTSQEKLTAESLPDEIKKSDPVVSSKQWATMAATTQKSLDEFENELGQIEKDYFSSVLEKAGGNKSKAAEILGIKRTTLNDRLKKLGL